AEGPIAAEISVQSGPPRLVLSDTTQDETALAHKCPFTAIHRVPAWECKDCGQGEMAQRVRNYDWASIALGPIEEWSNELLAIVNLTLCSPTPARTLWGPDLILI